MPVIVLFQIKNYFSFFGQSSSTWYPLFIWQWCSLSFTGYDIAFLHTGYGFPLVETRRIEGPGEKRIHSYRMSKDETYLAYQFSRNGSDWREIKVIRMKGPKRMDDHLRNVRFSSIVTKNVHGDFPEMLCYYSTCTNLNMPKCEISTL